MTYAWQRLPLAAWALGRVSGTEGEAASRLSLRDLLVEGRRRNDAAQRTDATGVRASGVAQPRFSDRSRPRQRPAYTDGTLAVDDLAAVLRRVRHPVARGTDILGRGGSLPHSRATGYGLTSGSSGPLSGPQFVRGPPEMVAGASLVAAVGTARAYHVKGR